MVRNRPMSAFRQRASTSHGGYGSWSCKNVGGGERLAGCPGQPLWFVSMFYLFWGASRQTTKADFLDGPPRFHAGAPAAPIMGATFAHTKANTRLGPPVAPWILGPPT